jgi:hypothetical protein
MADQTVTITDTDGPLTTDQRIRVEALKATVKIYANTSRATVAKVLQEVTKFEAYIRDGNTTP